MNNWAIRISGSLVVLSAFWYISWLLTNLNLTVFWLAVPFALANLLIVLSSSLAVFNNWWRATPGERPLPDGLEPLVFVIIPTCGEPPLMVERTARSVLQQDWPHSRLGIVISDDAHLKTIAAIVEQLSLEYPEATILYHEPPRRGNPARRGEAKAGNLNSALDFVIANYDEVAFIETRDADDEVGTPLFLRHCVGQLTWDGRAAYVQTIKEAQVSQGDPFCNREVLFYREIMLARYAANAVFPCGSGLVWRREALLDIGGFPAWNLVEDLQSGVEALRRGWHGIYLPIVGVISQHAPEDIPNVYKQRGTWALDTVRLLIWGNLRGLNFRQLLQFWEIGICYTLSFAMLVFLLVPVFGLLFRAQPILTDATSYVLHFWPFIVFAELFLCALNGKQSYKMLWRSREMWLGLSVVYAKAWLMALIAGRNSKPAYKITRKNHQFAWYWRETLPQIIFAGLLIFSLIFGVIVPGRATLKSLDLGLASCAIFYVILLANFVRKGWFGTNWNSRLKLSPQQVTSQPQFEPDFSKPSDDTLQPVHI